MAMGPPPDTRRWAYGGGSSWGHVKRRFLSLTVVVRLACFLRLSGWRLRHSISFLEFYLVTLAPLASV